MISDVLQQIDKNITLAINQLNGAYTDAFWQMMSDIAMWFPLYAAVLYAIYRRLGWKRGTVVLLSLILTVVACDQLANLVKNGVSRLRPCYDHQMLSNGLHLLERRTGYYGFFSGHAANAFGFAVASYCGLRNDTRMKYRLYGVAVFIWATLIAFSRVFVGKHYFGDILVGTLVGLSIGFLFAKVARFAIARIESSPSDFHVSPLQEPQHQKPCQS